MLIAGEVDEIRFLKHYRKIKIEGIDPKRILNKCLKNRITLQDLRWRDDISYTGDAAGR